MLSKTYKVRFSDPERDIDYIVGYDAYAEANRVVDQTNHKRNSTGTGLYAEFLGKEKSHTYRSKIGEDQMIFSSAKQEP